MNIMKKIKNRKIIVSLIISYVLVLIVPYIVNIINYDNMQNALIDEISNYNAEHLNGRRQNLDDVLANVSEMVNTIYLNNMFRETAELKGELTNLQLYNLSKDRAYIYGGFDFYIENVFVLYKNIDYYVGQNGTGNLNNFHRAYYSKSFSDFDKWYEFMTKRYYGELVIHRSSKHLGDSSVFYILSYMDNNESDNLLANIVVEFKRDFLLADNNEKNTFLLVDSDNRVVVCDGEDTFITAVNDTLSKNPDKNIINMEYKGQEKVLISQSLTQCDWKYISCISEEIMLEKVKKFRLNYIYSLFLCVLFGGAVIYYGTKKHYTPIKAITKTLSQSFAYDSDLDEYQYLTSIISKIITEYKTDSQYQRIEKKLAKNSFLLSVLKGEELLQPDIYQRLNYFGINFVNSYFCVASIHIDDCSKLFFEEDNAEENVNLAKLIVENVIEDLLKNKYEFAFCESDSEIYLMISLKNADEIEKLNEDLQEAQNVVQAVSNVIFSVTISNVYGEFRDISVCYREATELMQLCRIRNSSFLNYSDMENMDFGGEETYLYSAAVEQRLINYLLLGNYDDASMLLKEILNTNLKNQKTAFLKVKCLFFDIIATIFKIMHENEYVAQGVNLDKTDLLAKIDTYKSPEEIFEEMRDVFMQICTITKSNSAKNEDRLSDGIKDFVQMNYNDYNLNVAFIAQKFDVTANYVSTIFKKETGIALSEYISNVRIEHAKQLLKNTNIKASEIGDRVGFASFRTFSRVFSSSVGVSPGEYRKSNVL